MGARFELGLFMSENQAVYKQGHRKGLCLKYLRMVSAERQLSYGRFAMSA